jgi:hypothetical protein
MILDWGFLTLNERFLTLNWGLLTLNLGFLKIKEATQRTYPKTAVGSLPVLSMKTAGLLKNSS